MTMQDQVHATPTPHSRVPWNKGKVTGAKPPLMFIMPLVGWGMLSAARYPIVLYGPLRLPPILPHDLTLYAWLRDLHTDLAYLFFATFLAHFGAALFHGLIRRDGVLESMASWR
jgi:cytochrome b561